MRKSTIFSPVEIEETSKLLNRPTCRSITSKGELHEVQVDYTELISKSMTQNLSLLRRKISVVFLARHKSIDSHVALIC